MACSSFSRPTAAVSRGASSENRREKLSGVSNNRSVRAFSAWLRDFVALVDSFSLKPTAKQIRYANGCVEMSFDESVYVFLREYFNLPRFDDVLGLTVGDYLLAKKDNFNRMTIERNQLQALK